MRNLKHPLLHFSSPVVVDMILCEASLKSSLEFLEPSAYIEHESEPSLQCSSFAR